MSITILFVGLIVFLAHFLAALFDKKKIPDVLLLVFLGLIFGPLLRIVTPEFFGGFGNVLTTITLIVILFQGGLELNLSLLRDSLSSGLRLTAINFAATALVVTAISIPVFKVSILEGLILGSILGATSPAVVLPLIKKIALKTYSRTALFLESTFSDVLCIVVTLGLLQAVKYHTLNPGLMCGQIIASFGLASVIGIGFAFFWSTILYKIRRLENSMFLTPAFVFVLYGVTEFLGYSGAISSLAFGTTLGNISNFKSPSLNKFVLFRPVKFNRSENIFFAEVVFLLKTFFFIYIGLSIKMDNLQVILGCLALTVIIFLVRIPVVHLAMGKEVNRFDISIISAMVPKGLAAALLASLIIEAKVNNAMLIQDIIYSVILFSIVITALLTYLIEKNKMAQFYALVFSKYKNENISTIIAAEHEKENIIQVN